jgi:hypothetical protein
MGILMFVSMAKSVDPALSLLPTTSPINDSSVGNESPSRADFRGGFAYDASGNLVVGNLRLTEDKLGHG